MKPIIGSALPPRRVEREPFPHTPWKRDPLCTPWEFALLLLAILGTVAILMLPLWLS